MSREYVSNGAPVRRIPFALTPAEWVLCLDVKRLNDEAKLPGWIGKALDPTPRSRRRSPIRQKANIDGRASKTHFEPRHPSRAA